MAQETSLALESALAEIAAAGLDVEAIVRSRVRASTRDHRAEASRVRHEVIAGRGRASSSSFVDNVGDPPRRVVVELVALDLGRPATKSIVERQPPAATCLWVEVDRLMFLSGLTHGVGDLEEQVAGIFASLGSALSPHGLELNSVRQVDVFYHRGLPAPLVRAAVAARAPRLRCPIEWVPVDGFSSVQKRVEVEFTVARE